MSQQFTRTIPAQAGNVPGKIAVRAPGRFYYCLAADAAFQVQPDFDSKLDSRASNGFGTAGAKRWEVLTFFNTSNADIDVTFYSGDEAYAGPQDVSVSQGVSVQVTNDPDVTVLNDYLYVRPALTTTQGSTCPDDDETAYAASANRKQFAVFNAEASGGQNITVNAANGNGGDVPPQTWFTLETGSAFSVVVPVGAQQAKVIETIYV